MRIRIFIGIILLAVSAGCSSDPSEKLVRIAEKFKSGEIEEKEFIEFFTDYFNSGSMPDGNYVFDDTAVYFKDENKIHLRLPWRCNIDIDEKIKDFTLNASISEKKITIAHDKGFLLLSDSGSEIANFKISPKEKNSSVRGGIPFDGGAIYYMNNMLYKFDTDSKSASPLLKKKFKPVYEKFFDVKFLETDRILFMISGSAGTYRISAFDLLEKKLIIENIASASSKIFADKNSINYVAGATGDWSVTNLDLTTKTKKKINTLTEIRQIEIFQDGYMYENSSGLFVSSYNDKPVMIPYGWRLAGKYGNAAVIKINGRFVFADSSKFIKGCGLISFLYEK